MLTEIEADDVSDRDSFPIKMKQIWNVLWLRIFLKFYWYILVDMSKSLNPLPPNASLSFFLMILGYFIEFRFLFVGWDMDKSLEDNFV